ncbi:hypothetical protein BAE44_0012170 [Dichanthelium oligosanthes]|uniref:DUF3700 domain-containing protein n=1 Tax=Dichanthelium oligosanthes TaxID=888268 RepID=A0A1E5VNV2_9POAL|nr:hypothetical protein BAE44_0012170 [Dichanthelium oligosanthes]
MLAVFDPTVAKCPEGLRSPPVAGAAAAAGGGGVGALMKGFAAAHDGAVTVSLGSSGALAYSAANKNPLVPRLFGAVNDIFCLFQGHIENIANLKQHYGLSKTANEVTILIEAYRTLRDRGPVPASQVVRDLSGKFAFILYDTLSKSTFVAADADGSIPFFWGVDSEDHLVFSDDAGLLKTGCGNSFAPFPKGCFYTTSGGLQSFEHPLHEIKAVPRVDSQGQMCGSTFKVDSEAKKKQDASIPRVGSAADWSNQF